MVAVGMGGRRGGAGGVDIGGGLGVVVDRIKMLVTAARLFEIARDMKAAESAGFRMGVRCC